MKIDQTKLTVILIIFGLGFLSGGKVMGESKVPGYYEPYLALLDEVYQALEREYHYPVSRAVYEEYREKYKTSVLAKIPPVERRIDSIAYRGAGLLTMQLRHPTDTFTNFIPPEQAKAFTLEAYGQRHDIGITGILTDEGYLVKAVEIRSDSYEKGLRPGHIILAINGVDSVDMEPEQIEEKLIPELGEEVILTVYDPETGEITDLVIISEEYFRETVKEIPTGVEGIYCLKIRSFNRETAEDLRDLVGDLIQRDIQLLILDIRGNPGGPPLAVREMAGIFFPPETKLAYYQKKQEIVGGLMARESEVEYDGPLALLIDEQSGSSSELLAALFIEYGRGKVVGKQPTAGFSFLKGTAELEDGSMLIMVTGFTFLFNGQQLAFDGIEPNYLVPEEVEDILDFTVQEFLEGNLVREKGV